jgi:hypothetical protein
VRQAAMSAPFSLDAETPEGQRNWLLLYSEDYRFRRRQSGD